MRLAVVASEERDSVSALFGTDHFPTYGSCKPACVPAARSRRNRRAVRARSRVAEECADLVRRFRGKNVLELAGLLLNLGLAVHGQTVSEQPLSQPVPADDAARALAAARSEFDNQRSIANGCSNRLQRIVTWIHEWLVIMRFRRMRRRNHHPHLNHLFNCQTHGQRAVHFHALDFGDLSMLGQHPKFFQNLVELFFVGHGEYFLRGDLAVMQLDAPVGQTRH